MLRLAYRNQRWNTNYEKYKPPKRQCRFTSSSSGDVSLFLCQWIRTTAFQNLTQTWRGTRANRGTQSLATRWLLNRLRTRQTDDCSVRLAILARDALRRCRLGSEGSAPGRRAAPPKRSFARFLRGGEGEEMGGGRSVVIGRPYGANLAEAKLRFGDFIHNPTWQLIHNAPSFCRNCTAWLEILQCSCKFEKLHFYFL